MVLGALVLMVAGGCQFVAGLTGGLPGGSPFGGTGVAGAPEARQEIAPLAPGLSGQIRDGAGQPVAGAEIRVTPAFPELGGARTLEARTDDTGHFHMPDPPRGLVTVEARSGDLRAIRVGVPLRADLAGLDLGTLVVTRTGALVGRVKGPANLSLLGADIELLGTPYAAKADDAGRFELSTLPAGTYRVKASRPRFMAPLSAEIEIKSGETATVPDLALVPDAPVLASLGSSNGAVGAEIVLRGRNFGTETNEPFEVLFGNLRASSVRREADTAAFVAVPEGAMSGPVSIMRDGVPSDPLPFQVIATVSINPTYQARRPGENAELAVVAADTDGLPVSNPAVRWAAADLTRTDRTPALPADGIVLPPGEGFFEYTVGSGGVVAKSVVGVGSGTVSTMLGGPEALDTGDGGPAAAARLVRPLGVGFGPDGTLYFTDAVAGKIRAIGRDGNVRTFRAGLNSPRSVAITADGTLYYTESIGGGKYHVMRLAGDAVTELATGSFYSMGVGPGGKVAIAAGDRVYRVDTLGKLGDTPPILADGLTSAICVTFDPEGNLYAGETGRVWRYSATSRAPVAGGGPTVAPESPALEANLRTITGVAFLNGSLYFADASRQVIRQVMSDGRLRTVAGDGWTVSTGGSAGRFNGDGLALGASFNSPTAMAVHPDGGLVVADSGSNRLRWVRP